MSQVVNSEMLAGDSLPTRSDIEAISETDVKENSQTAFHSSAYQGTTEHYDSDSDFSVIEASSDSDSSDSDFSVTEASSTSSITSSTSSTSSTIITT